MTGMPGPAGGGVYAGAPQNYISGVNAPEYGRPSTMTDTGVKAPVYLPTVEVSRPGMMMRPLQNME